MDRKYTILGLHFGHDAGAAVVQNGQIIADVSEERFNRVKHSADLPLKAIEYCLSVAKISIEEIDEIALAGIKQDMSFEKIFGLPLPTAKPSPLPNLISFAKRLLKKEKKIPAPQTVPVYVRKFFLKKLPKITIVEHHLAHASCAYYTTNDKRKMVIATVDGIGDKCSSCIWRGEDGKITPIIKYGGGASIGWFYSNVTEALGWWHGDGEGKTMGLAPYGDFTKCKEIFDGIYPTFIDGTLHNPHHFSDFSLYRQLGAIHWHNEEATRITELVKKYGKENVSSEAQRILEEQVMKFVLPWLKKEKTDILATAGGVFLNVKLNQRIWMSGKVGTHYPYPNAGDSGLAIGAALYAAAEGDRLAEKIERHLYWGPEFPNEEIEKILKLKKIKYRKSDRIEKEIAGKLAEDKIIGWFQGRMESGPRALGNRSILMSPKKAENKDIINAYVKFREAFRPFCPSIVDEAKNDYLVKARNEEYMITSFDCVEEKKGELPAVVHVDGTLRPQTVTRESNSRYHALLYEFGKLTKTPVLLNSSFNIMGEPVVCTPHDAIRCFFGAGIDILAIGDFIVEK